MTTESINHPEKMITHPMGRFAMDIQANMRRSINKYKMWQCSIEEIQWPQDLDHDAAREAIWQQRLAEITALESPEGHAKALIEVRDFSSEQYWAKGILYYGDSYDDGVVSWDLLLDSDQIGVWIKAAHGKDYAKEKMADVIMDLATAWHSYPSERDMFFVKDGFHLKHGAIQQPFKYREELEIRFEGYPFEVPRYGNRPDDFILDIEMETTYEVEEVGLLERLAASLAMNFAPGVSVKKLRTGSRTIAGMKGDEAILRMEEGDVVMLSFSWNYLGKEKSGEYPEILIKMEAKEGQVDEKIALWDAMLNSLRPIGR